MAHSKSEANQKIRGDRGCGFWIQYFITNAAIAMMLLLFVYAICKNYSAGHPGWFGYLPVNVFGSIFLLLHLAFISRKVERTFSDPAHPWWHFVFSMAAYFVGLFATLALGILLVLTPTYYERLVRGTTLAYFSLNSVRLMLFSLAVWYSFETIYLFSLTIPGLKWLHTLHRSDRVFKIALAISNLTFAPGLVFPGSLPAATDMVKINPELLAPLRSETQGLVILLVPAALFFISLRFYPAMEWVDTHMPLVYLSWVVVLLVAAGAFLRLNFMVSAFLAVASLACLCLAIKRRSLSQLLLAPVERPLVPATGSAGDLRIVTIASGIFSVLVFVFFNPLGPNLSLRQVIFQGPNWAHIFIPPLISLVLYSFSLVMLFFCHQILRKDMRGEERKDLSHRLLPRLPVLLVPSMILPISFHLIGGQQLRSTFAIGWSDFFALSLGVAIGILHYIVFIHLPYAVAQKAWKRNKVADLRRRRDEIKGRIDELGAGVAVSPSDFTEYLRLDSERAEIPDKIQDAESLSIHPYRAIELFITFVRSNLATIFLSALALAYLVMTGQLASYMDAIRAGDWTALIGLLLDLFK